MERDADPLDSAEGVTVVLRDDGSAVVTRRGHIDPDGARRMSALLAAVVGAGATRVIVDLSASVGVPAELVEELVAVRTVLRGRGGWLLVEGGGTTADGDSELVEAFRAYRATEPSCAVLQPA